MVDVYLHSAVLFELLAFVELINLNENRAVFRVVLSYSFELH